MIELGGNIKLDGFHEIEPAMLVVIKKIVGNYAKKINEQAFEFGELSLLLDNSNKKFKIKASLLSNTKNLSSESMENNLFFALDNALCKILNDAKS